MIDRKARNRSDYAAESVDGRVRNPAAVFTSILKNRLGCKSGEKHNGISDYEQ